MFRIMNKVLNETTSRSRDCEILSRGAGSSKNKIAILTSGMGLGTYIPALVIRKQLTQLGVIQQIYIYETLFSQKAMDNYDSYKKLFHKDFRATIAGHKMPIKSSKNLINYELYDNLINKWKNENITKFLVLSGHWIHILDEYKTECDISIQCLRLDCGNTPSWKAFDASNNNEYPTTWLFDVAHDNLKYKISIDKKEPISFYEREKSFYVHGGGWGMGDFMDKINDIPEDLKLYISLYEFEETKQASIDMNREYYYLDNTWRPWHTDSNGMHTFPRTYKIKKNETDMELCESENISYTITGKVMGVISKPGGGTMIDALSSATPVIFLPPISEHERLNAEFFEENNLGISHEKWKLSHYSTDILYSIHLNLLKHRKKAHEYIELLCQTWF